MIKLDSHVSLNTEFECFIDKVDKVLLWVVHTVHSSHASTIFPYVIHLMCVVQ